MRTEEIDRRLADFLADAEIALTRKFTDNELNRAILFLEISTNSPAGVQDHNGIQHGYALKLLEIELSKKPVVDIKPDTNNSIIDHVKDMRKRTPDGGLVGPIIEAFGVKAEKAEILRERFENERYATVDKLLSSFEIHAAPLPAAKNIARMRDFKDRFEASIAAINLNSDGGCVAKFLNAYNDKFTQDTESWGGLTKSFRSTKVTGEYSLEDIIKRGQEKTFFNRTRDVLVELKWMNKDGTKGIEAPITVGDIIDSLREKSSDRTMGRP